MLGNLGKSLKFSTNIKFGIGLLCTFFSANILIAQGPFDGWMKGKNKTDFALSFNQESYDTYAFGKERRAEKNTIQSASLFLEHGFSDSLDLVVTIPYLRTPSCENCDVYNQGIQDAIVALKYRFSKTKKENETMKSFTAIGLSFPASNYSDSLERPIGARNTSFLARYFFQKDFNNGLFLHFQTGVDVRFIPSPLTSVPIVTKFGYAGNKIFLEGFAEYFYTFNGGTDTQISGGTGSIWLKMGATIYYPIQPNFGVYVKAAFIPDGENIGLSNTYGFGAAYRLKWK